MSRAHDLDKTNGRLDGGAHSGRAQLAGALPANALDNVRHHTTSLISTGTPIRPLAQGQLVTHRTRHTTLDLRSTSNPIILSETSFWSSS